MKKKFASLTTFPLALQLLSILSIPAKVKTDEKSVAMSMAWFPVVGLLIGFILATIWYLSSLLFPSLLASIVVVVSLATITRGLHLDGLSDTLDGLGGAYTKEKRLKIMKDTHIGAFGVVAIVFAILFKTVAIYELPGSLRIKALIIFPVLSRFAMVFVSWKCPYARREGGLGKNYVEYLESGTMFFALAVSAIIAGFLLLHWGLLLMMSVLLVALAFSAFFNMTLGGVTGDVLGAVNELCEIIVLLLLLALPVG